MADEVKTQKLYDRVADVHNVAAKMNGYRKSVANYLRSLKLDLGENPLVLDAGSGTGIVSLGVTSAGLDPKRMISLDLSLKSLKVARDQYKKDRFTDASAIDLVQGDILKYPFEDNAFDLIVTCGALEYVPLDDGLAEMARILKPGGKLVLMPIKPSVVGSVLEILYKFKKHKFDDVRRVAMRYFLIVGDYTFAPIEPIGWSKSIFLLEKKKDGFCAPSSL
jgi:ubiquinone/menaquinone biosynthesis C-methylase UbiE